jgi:hypothetical protein
MSEMKIIFKRLRFSFFVTVLILLTSCSTYLIPIDSFKKQFNGIDSTKFRRVLVSGPIGESYSYDANPIVFINCVDKSGNPHELINSPSIEIRFTYGEKNKRCIFYFDRIFVSDSCVVGVQSRFFSSIRKTIPLKTISKIEIQDGKKNFHYIDR